MENIRLTQLFLIRDMRDVNFVNNNMSQLFQIKCIPVIRNKLHYGLTVHVNVVLRLLLRQF